MSGVGVGVTVGNAALTMAATVASISTVGAAVGVGESVAVGVGACAEQASTMKPKANRIIVIDRQRIQTPSAIRAPFYQKARTTRSRD